MVFFSLDLEDLGDFKPCCGFQVVRSKHRHQTWLQCRCCFHCQFTIKASNRIWVSSRHASRNKLRTCQRMYVVTRLEHRSYFEYISQNNGTQSSMMRSVSASMSFGRLNVTAWWKAPGPAVQLHHEIDQV